MMNEGSGDFRGRVKPKLEDLTPELAEYGTPRQSEVLRCVLKHQSYQRASEELETSVRRIHDTITRLCRRAARMGWSPQHDMTHPVPDGFMIKGTSTYYGEDGQPRGQWVKTQVDAEVQRRMLEECAESMAADLPRRKAVKYVGKPRDSHQFSVVPVGDPHVGLRTWAAEVGVDWDVPIALRVYEAVFRRLFERTPDTEEAVLFNSGDFFHADNLAGVTERSGHRLDLDGRPGYWLGAGIQLLRLLIDMCLSKYERVTLINTPGNHDDLLGLALGIFAQHLYENEPRITVQPGIAQFQYFERGNVALGFCHGHTCKLSALPGKMAHDQSEMWGRTTYRHWFTGHVHHNSWTQFKEHPGCTVESVGIIPPRDFWAYGAGYGSNRSTQVAVFDDRGYLADRHIEIVRGDE